MKQIAFHSTMDSCFISCCQWHSVIPSFLKAKETTLEMAIVFESSYVRPAVMESNKSGCSISPLTQTPGQVGTHTNSSDASNVIHVRNMRLHLQAVPPDGLCPAGIISHWARCNSPGELSALQIRRCPSDFEIVPRGCVPAGIGSVKIVMIP